MPCFLQKERAISDLRKSIVSITDMARLVGLSRQRFGQLVREGVFPSADHDPTSGRPFYNSDKQQLCLLVRQTNTGINGRAILFYSRRRDTGTKRATAKARASTQDTAVVQQLAELGLSVTMREIETATAILFPDGATSVAPEALLKSLFLHFRRRNRRDTDG